MKLTLSLFGAALAAAIGAAAAPANAGLVLFSGLDVGQSAPIGPNSAAAHIVPVGGGSSE